MSVSTLIFLLRSIALGAQQPRSPETKNRVRALNSSPSKFSFSLQACNLEQFPFILQLATVECQVIYIGRTGKIKIRGVDKIIRKIAAKDMTGVVRSLAFWGEYAYTPLIEEGAAMKTVACITGLRYDPEQGYSTTRR